MKTCVFCFIALFSFCVFSGEPVELRKNRKIYLRKLKEIEKERDEKVRKLTAQYVGVLRKVKIERTKAGDLEGALAVKKAIEKIEGILVTEKEKPSEKPVKEKPVISYNADQWGYVTRSSAKTANNVWSITTTKYIRRLKITVYIAALHESSQKADSYGRILFSNGKEEPVEIGKWKTGDRYLKLVNTGLGGFSELPLSRFGKAKHTVKDLKPGSYKLQFVRDLGGNCALAIRKVEIKED